jgi:hypothetical protein
MLGMEHRTISIEPMLAGFRQMPGFTDIPYLLGNLMARIRMTVLYYHANRDNRLVCGTSNRSEYMLGYCTKFGDNAADIQPILHLYKSDVYLMAKELGIPESILKKHRPPDYGQGRATRRRSGSRTTRSIHSLRALEKPGVATEKYHSRRRCLRSWEKSGHKKLGAPSLLAGSQKPSGYCSGKLRKARASSFPIRSVQGPFADWVSICPTVCLQGTGQVVPPHMPGFSPGVPVRQFIPGCTMLLLVLAIFALEHRGNDIGHGKGGVRRGIDSDVAITRGGL